MTAVDLSPEVPYLELGTGLRTNIQRFDFDHEGYRQGLNHLGIPTESVESLEVCLNAVEPAYDIRHVYNRETHRVEVDVPLKIFKNFHLPGVTTESKWDELPITASVYASYFLALTAHQMRDELFKHPELVRVDRQQEGRVRRQAIAIGVGTALGAVAGAILMDSAAGTPIATGFGAMAGWVESAFHDNRSYIEAYEVETKLKQRRREFASSEVGFELFSDVVHIEFLKKEDAE